MYCTSRFKLWHVKQGIVGSTARPCELWEVSTKPDTIDNFRIIDIKGENRPYSQVKERKC